MERSVIRESLTAVRLSRIALRCIRATGYGDLELAVGLFGRDDDVLGAAVGAMRVAARFVVFRRHHVDEGGHGRIIHQRQIVPLMAVLPPERDRLGVARP